MSYARHICNQAKQLISEEMQDDGFIRATAGECLLRIIEEGMASKKMSDRKLVVEAIKELTRLAPGVRAPTEHTVTVDRKEETMEELIAIAEALAAREKKDLVLSKGADDVYSE